MTASRGIGDIHKRKRKEKNEYCKRLRGGGVWESENSVFAALVLRQFSVYATILRNYFIFIPRK